MSRYCLPQTYADMRHCLSWFFVGCFALSLSACINNPTSEAETTVAEASTEPDTDSTVVLLQRVPVQTQVLVTVGDGLFTAYRYADSLKKPILFPIRASDGTIVTRGYPLSPRAGEQLDHPHHTGHWLNHGVVNGVDFWTSAPGKRKPDDEDKVHGSIVHRSIDRLVSGNPAVLAITADWISDPGDTLLVEHTQFAFSQRGNQRIIDRTTTLVAHDGPVTFSDSKEGMMAVRIARFLEQPDTAAHLLVDSTGKTGKEPLVDTTSTAGQYHSSEGLIGDEVWGTRAEWVSLSAPHRDKHYAITIMDHPDNVNYPTHWMARGYGLFAANPLGSAAYTDGREKLNHTLAAGDSTTLRYRILIHQGNALPDSVIQQRYEDFVK